jgi:hypothetical protein
VNWSTIVFNNLYNRLWDLSALTKIIANKDNIKFSAAQVVDILLQNWFPVDLTSIISNLKEEDEGAAKPAQKLRL